MPASRALVVAAFLAASAAIAEQQRATSTVHCGHMIDVRAGVSHATVAITVAGGRIAAIAPDTGGIAPGDVDARAATCVPGFIDAHTHLLLDNDPALGGDDLNGLVTLFSQSDALRALHATTIAREMLQAGFTTVRDLGNSGRGGDVALRTAIRNGWVLGPRMLVSTRALAPLGGQASGVEPVVQVALDQEYAIVTGPTEARRAVRQALFDGADVIKVIVNVGPRMLGPDELEAIVSEAHRARVPVAAHVVGDSAARLAIDAGVTSIEHAYEVSEATFKRAAQRGVWLVPTDMPLDHFLAFYPDSTSRERQLPRLQDLVRRRQIRFANATAAGVRIALGSDAYYRVPGRTRGRESAGVFQAYVEFGMTPMAALQAGTIRAAELLGVDALVGSLDVGKVADIVVVAGDPLADIKTLQKPLFVIHQGTVVPGLTLRLVP